MSIEELNKQQIVLLAILVSFVTAVTAGILTVVFLTPSDDQDDQMDEQITTESSSEPATSSEPVQEEVNNDTESETPEPITLPGEAVIEASVEAVARLTNEVGSFVGAGVLVSTDGEILVVTASDIGDSSGIINALWETGETAELQVINSGEQITVLGLSAQTNLNETDPLAVASDGLDEGESVLVLAVEERPRVIEGTVSDVADNSVTVTAEIEATRFPPSSLLLDDNGTLAGLLVATESSEGMTQNRFVLLSSIF